MGKHWGKINLEDFQYNRIELVSFQADILYFIMVNSSFLHEASRPKKSYCFYSESVHASLHGIISVSYGNNKQFLANYSLLTIRCNNVSDKLSRTSAAFCSGTRCLRNWACKVWKKKSCTFSPFTVCGKTFLPLCKNKPITLFSCVKIRNHLLWIHH